MESSIAKACCEARRPRAARLAARERIARAVATSTRRERARDKLDRTALLPWFQAFVGGDDIAPASLRPTSTWNCAPSRSKRRRLSGARRLGARHPRGHTPLEYPDHGAGSAAPSSELALDFMVLPTLHEVLQHLVKLPP